MRIIKFILWGFVLVAIIGYSIYTNIISWLTWAITNFKANFLDYLPSELLLTVSIIIFWLIVFFVYSFLD